MNVAVGKEREPPFILREKGIELLHSRSNSSVASYAGRRNVPPEQTTTASGGFPEGTDRLANKERKKFPEKPAIVVELKWDKDVSGAIAQIKNKEYCRSLEEYRGNVLLVGVNYDKKTKVHECMIEECEIW